MTVSMGAIGDEIREFVRRSYADEHMDPKELLALADRVDAELVELPRDRDGVPIHVGDTVYLDDGHMAKVVRIELMQTKSCIDCWVSGGKSVGYLPSGISHKPADSWEHIANELEAWCDDADVDGDACEKPRDIVERIRKLAAKEDE